MGKFFQFFDDLAEWNQLDKLAHFVWAFHITAVAARLLTWAKSIHRRLLSQHACCPGFSFPRLRYWMGSLLTMARRYMTSSLIPGMYCLLQSILWQHPHLA